MNIDLGPQWESFIEENVRNGRYTSASDVVQTGLRMLQASQQDREQRLAQLRKLVDEGIAAIESGDYEVFDAESLGDFIEQVKAEGREELVRRKASSE